MSRSHTYEVLISFAAKYRQPQPCLPVFKRAVYVSREFWPGVSVGRRPTLSRVKKAAATKISLFAYLWQLFFVRSYLNELSGRFHQCAKLVVFLAGLFAGLPEEFAGKAIYNGSTGHSQQNMAKGRYDMVETPKVPAI